MMLSELARHLPRAKSSRSSDAAVGRDDDVSTKGAGARALWDGKSNYREKVRSS